MPLDLRPSFADAVAAFGLAASVTAPDAPAAVSTAVVWLPPMEEPRPFGTEWQRRSPRRVAAFPRASGSAGSWSWAGVDEVPIGSVVVVAETDGAAARSWRVDGLLDAIEPDHIRVAVSPQREY